MPIERECPKCTRRYTAIDTLCVNPTCNTLDPPAPAALIVGTNLPAPSNDYTITKVLGWGGMATAYLTLNRAQQPRVVKEMLPSGKPTTHAKLERMFEREAQIQERLGHQLTATPPAFPPFPVGEGPFRTHGRLFMAMEYMEGEDLDKIQDRLGAIPFLQVLQYGIEVCIVLRDYLHGYVEMGMVKPLIHRDIKPANLHVLRATNTACLLDFGIARFESYTAATQARGGTRAGSPAFSMPEQLQKGKQITASTDIGSLCATLWALIANAKEFPDMRPDQIAGIRTHVQDTELQAILIRGTDENPAGRYQSADELRLELVRVHEAHRPLPAHLKPVVTATAAAPIPKPVAAASAAQPVRLRYKIVWDNTPTVAMANGTEYQRDLTGKVVEHHRFGRNQPAPQLNVVVTDIVDSGGGHPSGVSRVMTDATGYFHIDQIDTRVPITVVERRLRIVVEETNGTPVHDEVVRIKRPHQFAKRFGGAVASPFQGMGARMGQAFSGTTSYANLFVLLALVFFALAAYGVAKDNGYIWSICLWMTFVAGRASSLSRRRKLPGAWKWAVFPRLSFMIVGSWLVLLIADFFGR